MALEILNSNKQFTLKGNLTQQTINLFMDYFNKNILDNKSIIINIDQLTIIDKAGANLLKDFIKNNLKRNNLSAIVGLGSKDLYDDLLSNKAA